MDPLPIWNLWFRHIAKKASIFLQNIKEVRTRSEKRSEKLQSRIQLRVSFHVISGLAQILFSYLKNKHRSVIIKKTLSEKVVFICSTGLRRPTIRPLLFTSYTTPANTTHRSNAGPMLPNVVDGGQTLVHHWIDVLCLLGRHSVLKFPVST